MSYLDEVFGKLKRWEPLGVMSYPDGCRLIGHTPHLGAAAYLHRIPPPLLLSDVDELEQSLDRQCPDELQHLYLRANGLTLFSTFLHVCGLRRSWDRANPQAMNCQPFDIWTPTVLGRPPNSPPRAIFVMQYPDSSRVYLDEAGTVRRCSSTDAAKTINCWATFGQWLVAEVGRYSTLFDDAGRCLVEFDDLAPAPDNVN